MRAQPRKRRRCPRCQRWVGQKNTTEYRQIEPKDVKWWPLSKRINLRGNAGASIRSCNNCGRRGLVFFWWTYERILKAVYMRQIVDLLNSDVLLYKRFAQREVWEGR